MTNSVVDVIGLGELLWDCFPDRRLPGGAPANVAFQAQQLGLTAAVATRVGTDPLGDELVAFLKQQGLRTDFVQRDPIHGTGTVTVQPEGVPGPRYVFLENSAWDFLEPTPQWRQAFDSARAICFGTLAQREPASRATIQQLIREAGRQAAIIFDVNLRPPFWSREVIESSLEVSTIVKLNDDEVRTLATMFAAPSSDNAEFARWLLERWLLDLVCVTRGANGAVAVSRTETVDVPGTPVEVVDTVGAGDAFTAAIIWSQLKSRSLRSSIELACRIGALVASRAGAMPDLRTEFATVLLADSRDG